MRASKTRFLFRGILLAAALAAFFLWLPQPEPANAATDAFAIRGARIFDGERLLPAGTVVVEGGRIAAVGEAVEVPPGAEVVDGTGKTLLPGLIESHVHIFGDGLERNLLFGVTTVLDMFTDQAFAAVMRGEQARGEADDRADLFSAGTLITAAGGHGTQFGLNIPTLGSAAEAKEFIAARVAEGSDFIKLVVESGESLGFELPTLDAETVTAVVAAAHEHDKLAVAHIGSYAEAKTAAAAGADGLVHLFMDRLPEESYARSMAEQGMFVIPTLTVLEGLMSTDGGHALADDESFAERLRSADRAQLKRSFGLRPVAGSAFAHAVETVARLRAAGVPVLAGSDAPNPGTAYGASLHRELELLVLAGLSEAEALAAATSVPARSFGLDDRGRIAPGLRADLLLVEGDPTADITATRDIVAVWKGGQRAAVGAGSAEPARARVPEAGRVSDFDGGEVTADFGTGWIPSTDSMRGGTSTVELEVVAGGAAGSSHSLRATGELTSDTPFPWAGPMFFPGSQPMEPVDFTGRKELVFHARGDGQVYQVMFFAESTGPIPGLAPFTAGPEWAEVKVPLSRFTEDLSGVQGVLFSGGQAIGEFRFQIDSVEFR